MILILSKYCRARLEGARGSLVQREVAVPWQGDARTRAVRSLPPQIALRLCARDTGGADTGDGTAPREAEPGFMRGCPGAARTRQPPHPTHTNRHRAAQHGQGVLHVCACRRLLPPQPTPAQLSPATLRENPRRTRPLVPCPADLHCVDRGRRLLRGERAEPQRLHGHPRTAALQHSASPRAPARRSKVPAPRSPGAAKSSQALAARPALVPGNWQSPGSPLNPRAGHRPRAGAAGGPGGGRDTEQLGFKRVSCSF